MKNSTNRGGAQDAAEQAVQKIKEELGPFVVAADATRMPMFFTDATSQDNDIVYVNESFLKLTGYDQSSAIGMPFRCLLAHKEDRAHMTPSVIASREGSSLDLRCVRKDRTEFDAAVLVSPVRDKDGELQQYFVSVVDLTGHVERRIQNRLREAEMFKHTPGFIAFTDGPDHRLVFANTAYESLVGRSDVIGSRVADLFPELVEQGLLDLLDKVYNSGERIVGNKVPIRLKRGRNGEMETRYIDFINQPVRDSSGAVIGLFCEGYDTTDAQVALSRLEDVQGQLMHISRLNAMGTMAATLAHEINQPLAAIANYAAGCLQILKSEGHRTEKLHEGLSAIEAASDRAGKIIGQLRDMTKRAPLKNDVFDLSDALEEAVDLVRAGGCESVSLSTHCAPSLFVRGDRIQVQQVIINLLRNACYAAAETGDAGLVIARSMRKGGRPSITVRDNGPGLPEGVKDDVFKWTESTKADGMGIGLSVCRTIAEFHGGEIAVDQTGPSGTSITFALPETPTSSNGAPLT